MTLIGSSHARPCRICGVSGCACGGPTTVRGLDPLNPEETVVSDKDQKDHSVHAYEVHANGYDTIMNLTEEDAENYPGAKKVSGPLAPDHPDRDDDREKSSAREKSRSAPNK